MSPTTRKFKLTKTQKLEWVAAAKRLLKLRIRDLKRIIFVDKATIYWDARPISHIAGCINSCTRRCNCCCPSGWWRQEVDDLRRHRSRYRQTICRADIYYGGRKVEGSLQIFFRVHKASGCHSGASINQSINITVLTPHLDGNKGHKGEPTKGGKIQRT